VFVLGDLQGWVERSGMEIGVRLVNESYDLIYGERFGVFLHLFH
jgi:hypothetical protein